MNQPIKTIETARDKIQTILRRYRLEWEDVAPDMDEIIWKTIAPTARKIRGQLFRKYYPSLSAPSKRKKKA